MVDRGAVRPHRRGRRVHHRRDRRGARRQPDPDPEAGRRRVDGRGRVHRLRRVRGGLPERRRQPVHRRQARPPQPAPAGPGRALQPAPRRWSRRWRSTSGRARTTASARRPARRDLDRRDRADERRLPARPSSRTAVCWRARRSALPDSVSPCSLPSRGGGPRSTISRRRPTSAPTTSHSVVG